MPRGTRALHEVSGDTSGPMLIAVSPEVEYLASVCWCDRYFVIVEQSEVVACRTKSCGQRDCKSPEGDDEVALVVLGPSNTAATNVPRQAITTLERYLGKVPKPKHRGPTTMITRHERERRDEEETKRNRIGRWEVAMRREDVAQYWRKGLPYSKIAALVGASVGVVSMDIQYLKSKGILPNLDRRKR